MLQILGTSQRARLKVIQENCFILTAFNRMVQNIFFPITKPPTSIKSRQKLHKFNQILLQQFQQMAALKYNKFKDSFH